MNENHIAKEHSGNDEIEFELLDFEEMDQLLSEDIDDLLADVTKLTAEKELISNPESLGKEIYKSIFDQLGAQNELDMSGELLIDQYKRKHEGETKKSALDDAMKDKDYQKARKANTEASKANGGIKDAYTGKIIRESDGHKVNTDHVISRSELYGEGIKKRFRELSGNTVADLANIPDNLVATTESANKSKKDKKVKDYIKGQEQRKRDLTEQHKKKIDKINNDGSLSVEQKEAKIKKEAIRYKDKMDIDTDKMTDVDSNARKSVNKKKALDSAKNVGKAAGAAALRTLVMQSAATFIKSMIDNLINFFKSKQKSFSTFKEKVKKAFSDFFKSLSKTIKSSFSSAKSSVMNNLLNVLFEPIKKIWSGIKTVFSTIKEGTKAFLSPENKEEDMSIRIAKVGKILTAGIVTTGVVLLSETITQLLETTFPALKGIRIPILGSLTGFIVELILAVLGGILTGFIINKLNKFIEGKKKAKIDKAIIEKQNDVLEKQDVRKTLTKKHTELTKKNTVTTISKRHLEANELSSEILEEIFMPIDKDGLSLEKMQEDLDLLL